MLVVTAWSHLCLRTYHGTHTASAGKDAFEDSTASSCVCGGRFLAVSKFTSVTGLHQSHHPGDDRQIVRLVIGTQAKMMFGC